MAGICWAIIWLILFAKSSHGFHLLGPYNYRHTFSMGDAMFAKVNSLTSIETQLPFSYYTLPYCVPQIGIRQSELNLGQRLLGDEILNSPYRFRMNVNETVFLCSRGLNADEVKLLKQRTHDLYQVNIFLDYLPIMRFVNQNDVKIIQWTGFPVGYTPTSSNEDYIINHLHFRVLINEHEQSGLESFDVVGFEVVPCSVKHNLATMSKLDMYENVEPIYCPADLEDSQVIRENETVVFTYAVEYVKSDIKWASRWDAYLELGLGQVRFYSILSTLIAIFILAGIMLAIYLRTVRREVAAPYEQLNEDLPGWKLVVEDVFREPVCAKLLCIMVGDGIQITGMTLSVMTAFFATGFVSPASRGTLLTSLILLYLVFSIVAGYTAVTLWTTIKGSSKGWKSVSLYVVCFFPGIVFVVLTCLNVLLSNAKSTMAIPTSLFLILLSLWLCISVPLTLIGGFIGTKKEPIQHPVQTNHVAREIPGRKYLSWLVVISAGSLPFGALFIELFLILSSIWLGRFYYEVGSLLFALLMLVLVCGIVSVILTYMRLRLQDWRWWWKAFFATGSVGTYVFCYSMYYLVYDLQGLSGPVSAALYTGYTLIVAIAVMLATGAIGFLMSFYFVHHLYSVKVGY